MLHQKGQRKPLATITGPVATNVPKNSKVDVKKQSVFEKENEIVPSVKVKVLKEVKVVKEVKEVKEVVEVKKVKEVNEVEDVKAVEEVIEVKEVKDVKAVKEVKEVIEVKEAKEVKDEKAVEEVIEVKEVEKGKEVTELQEVEKVKKAEEVKDVEEVEVDKENVENEMLSPISDYDTTSETFGIHEDDWCFSKMLFWRVPEYEEEIQKYLMTAQVKTRPDPEYMTRLKPEINEKMRSILVDWMTEVVEEYKMTAETLFLAINFIDRYLSAKAISRSKLQLLGTSVLFISSKYEEIYPPDVNEFVYITDNSYEKCDILKMEQEILKVLNWNVSAPTAAYFLRKHLYTIGLDINLPQTVGIMAEYLCFISLLEVKNTYLPNDIAVSAIILSASLFGIKIDLSGMTGQLFFPGFTAEQLKAQSLEIQSCVDFLYHLGKSVKAENDALFKSGKPHQAIFSKFAQEKYYSISLLDIGSQEAPKLIL